MLLSILYAVTRLLSDLALLHLRPAAARARMSPQYRSHWSGRAGAGRFRCRILRLPSARSACIPRAGGPWAAEGLARNRAALAGQGRLAGRTGELTRPRLPGE